ncbi:MAG: alpha/beta fold hydrolase [Chloroflexota bacterium]
MKTKQLFILFVFSMLLIACASAENSTDSSSQDSPIVLVHGAWQDGSSWVQVQQELEANGHTVSAVTLPGRDGEDAGAQTLEGYRDAVIAEVESYDEPVILVGHSFGGMTISAVAEAIPDQIASLVYLAAYLPSDGDSLLTLSEEDHISVLGEEGNLNFSEDSAVASVTPEKFAELFCPDCSDASIEAVTASAVGEPAAPLAQPISLTDENFGAVSKAYILTSQDIVVGTQLQVMMLANTPVDQIFVLDTGHAPYVTAAAEIAGLLDQLQQ